MTDFEDRVELSARTAGWLGVPEPPATAEPVRHPRSPGAATDGYVSDVRGYVSEVYENVPVGQKTSSRRSNHWGVIVIEGCDCSACRRPNPAFVTKSDDVDQLRSAFGEGGIKEEGEAITDRIVALYLYMRAFRQTGSEDIKAFFDRALDEAAVLEEANRTRPYAVPEPGLAGDWAWKVIPD